ncbi:MAG TPA: carboxypeptidase regulatory-like domain-containing protein [Terriglobales bacterium]|jgi:Polysaccharide lyase family 4, domain II|nr:carboxypeptidase regulatory-like domain-containing protein [Terriglobales bacterium]
MKRAYRNHLVILLATIVVLTLGTVLLDQNVQAAGDGSITGSVKLSGTAPHMKGIDMSKDPYCVKQHENSPVKMENVVVGSGGGLANVVLYISQGLTGNEASAVPSEQPEFDQKGCMYTPHVLAMDVNQQYKVVTSDQTTHNIHPLPAPGAGNIGWNKSQPPGAPPIVTSWKAEEVAISVKCNIHPWMHGWFAVVKGPYATTDDSGNYTIKNVPAGSYTVTAWQEELGTQTAKVTVSAGGTGKADFTFKAK